jgi:hypothetical protein
MKIGGIWYVMMTNLQRDKEAQRNGFVFVLYYGTDPGFPLQEHFARAKMARKIWGSLPFRLVGMHACYDDSKLRPMLSVIPALMEKARLVRFRAHFGES